MLFKAAQLIADRKEQYARDMTREMGKVLSETRGDVQEAIDMTFYMAGEGRRMFGQTVPSELRNKFAMSVRQPLGVCSIITPWNFPMAIPSWKIIPALVCGNTVVFKPASQTPLSAWNFVKVLEDAGIPRGVVNMVTGDGDEVGTPLTTSPASSRGVVHRIDQSRAHRQPGGGADVQESPPRDGRQERHHDHGRRRTWSLPSTAASGADSARQGSAARQPAGWWSHEKVYDAFVSRFVARARALVVGDGLDASVRSAPRTATPSCRRS